MQRSSSWTCKVHLYALLTILVASAVTCGITVPRQTIQELVSKALVESLATKQRDLLDDLIDDYDDSQNYADESLGRDPEEMPGFYEGDMAGVNDELARVGINFLKFPSRKWTNNTVPYIISPLYLPDEYMIIKTAVRILNFFTCINFRDWDGVEKDYLIFWPVEKPAGCWSYVGRLGGPQIVSLQQPDLKSAQCFAGVGRPLHETMHALGVYHEQSRPDRDDHVKVEKKNVIRGFLSNFDKLDTKNVSAPYKYDYDSIMHYGTTFFSKNKKIATLVPKQKGKSIGQRINLSKLDCLKLNSLYGCLDESPFSKRKYETICEFLGL
ncbi:unnamed protein product [Allacma fusca]|uniref:Peptidase M12A domain-containing protein n=1 Tax=Allacma fusca TaxID=39272 RepID=A0A8J2MB03_9HEXA|nr:unnamed protein product [Allacma fusca]